MDLHRASKRPDWVKIPYRRRNGWQRLAGDTGGIVTVGNVVTVIGLAVVLAGLALVLRGNYGVGLALVVAGRLCDLLDGWLASRTGTKSPLGEIIDAGADKIGILAAAAVLVIVDIVPLWFVVALVGLQFLIALASRIAWDRGRALHPSEVGKVGMAAAWLGISLFMLAEVVPDSTDVIRLLAYIISVFSLFLATVSLVDYIKQQT